MNNRNKVRETVIVPNAGLKTFWMSKTNCSDETQFLFTNFSFFIAKEGYIFSNINANDLF